MPLAGLDGALFAAAIWGLAAAALLPAIPSRLRVLSAIARPLAIP